MASDLSKALSSTEEFRQSLELIRTDQQDYDTFFEDVFIRLEATLAVAAREQRAWEQQRAQKESILAEQSEELDRKSRALESRHEEFLAEALASLQEQFQQQYSEQAAQERQALQDALASSSSQAERLAAVAESMAAAQQQYSEQAQNNSQTDLTAVGELETRLKETLQQAAQEHQALQDALASSGSQAERLTSVTEALAASQETFQQQIEQQIELQNEASSNAQPPAASEEVLARLQQLEEERAEILQGRTMLETELESVRQRAVDLMTALEHQKRLTGEQQNQLNNEVRRQRQLLEQVLKRLVELEMSPVASVAPSEPAATVGSPNADTDSVLSSVMAQFDVLQKDIARRRSKSVNNSLRPDIEEETFDVN